MLRASIWREVVIVLGLGVLVGPPLCWRPLSLDATIGWLGLATGLLGATLILLTGFQAARLRGRLAKAIAHVAA